MAAAALGAAMPSAWTAGDVAANALTTMPPTKRYFAPARRKFQRRMVVSLQRILGQPIRATICAIEVVSGESRQSSSTHRDNECTGLSNAKTAAKLRNYGR